MNNYLPPTLTLSQAQDYPASFGNTIQNALRISALRLPNLDSFIITSAAYREFINHHNLSNQLKSIISNLDVTDPHQLSSISSNIQKRLLHHPYNNILLKNLKKNIKQYLHGDYFLIQSDNHAHPQSLGDNKQLVKGHSLVFDTLRRFWSHNFLPQNLIKIHQNSDLLDYCPSILIYEFPLPAISGSITVRPPQNKKYTLIQAVHGISPNLNLHDKLILPHKYYVYHLSGDLVKQEIISQAEQITIDRFGHLKSIKVSSQNNSLILNKNELRSLSAWGKSIQNQIPSPVQIIWLKSNNKLFIVGINPSIENLTPNPPEVTKNPDQLTKNMQLISQGIGAGSGIVSAPARIIKNPHKPPKINSGEIIVAPYASYQLITTMRKAVGMVTDQGGSMSHTAILARELGIPLIVAAKNVSSKIKNGQVITINGSNGKIYNGGLPAYQTLTSNLHKNAPHKYSSPINTATKIMLNISTPHNLHKWTDYLSDGIGALLGNMLLIEFGYHPLHIIKKYRQKYLQYLINSILQIAKYVPSQPILYHSVDLTSAQRSKLIGGKSYELYREENPILGLRGASYINIAPDFFELELAAIRTLRHKHRLHNLHLVFPSVRNRQELHQLKRFSASLKLPRTGSFNLFLPLIYPANIFQISSFSKEGIDGCIFHLNLISHLFHGIDPNNQELRSPTSPNNTPINHILETACTKLHQHNLKSIIYGHSLNKNSHLLSQMVKNGIWGITTDPLSYNATKHEVYYTESTLINNL